MEKHMTQKICGYMLPYVTGKLYGHLFYALSAHDNA